MPNCTASEMPLSKMRRREIDVRFDGGDVSSNGGLLFLLRQVGQRLGLLKAVAQILPDPRRFGKMQAPIHRLTSALGRVNSSTTI
jgi:hypothetical protein